jgi:hypothetical protein
MLLELLVSLNSVFPFVSLNSISSFVSGTLVSLYSLTSKISYEKLYPWRPWLPDALGERDRSRIALETAGAYA